LAPVPVAAQTDARLLRIVAPWEITGLDPVRSGYIFQRMQVAETLVGADDAGAPLPGLATQWDISDDRLQWRFVLRRGARFHDGAPVEAPHVVRVLERTRTPPGLLSATPIASIAAEAGAVVIRTTRPFMALTAFLAHSNTIILAPAAYDSAGAVRQIIGSGPFRAVEVTPPLRIETARFEGWSGAAPAIARASYLAVSRGETRALMADGGQAELVYTLDPASIERLRRNRRLDVRIMAIPRTQLMKFNAGGPFFGDVRVRRAVGFAIDREGIARAILRNPAAAATQLFPPTLAEWHVPELPKLRHDPAMARSLLAAAGWSPGSDQVLQREGRPFRVTLRTFPDRPELPVIAAAIQDQLRSVGIDMQIAVANSSEIPAGHRDGTLDLGLMARNFSLVPDPIGTLLTDFGPGGGDWGAMGWSSGELVETLARLGAVSETAERRALRRRTSEILQSELPVMPIGWYDHSVAVSRSLTEVSVDPLELSYRIAAMRWAG
jgi:peptide/nickel transport system substrate-binding protein